MCDQRKRLTYVREIEAIKDAPQVIRQALYRVEPPIVLADTGTPSLDAPGGASLAESTDHVIISSIDQSLMPGWLAFGAFINEPHETMMWSANAAGEMLASDLAGIVPTIDHDVAIRCWGYELVGSVPAN